MTNNDIRFGNNFLGMAPMQQKKTGFIKSKMFCTSKDTTNKVKGNSQDVMFFICTSYIL